MLEEFQRDITFHAYQDLLRYGVDVCDGNLLGKGWIKPLPIAKPKEIDQELSEGFEKDVALDKKNKVEQKLFLHPSVMHNQLEVIP